MALDASHAALLAANEHDLASPEAAASIQAGEILVVRETTADYVEAIRKAAQTGRIGDGKIFISNIEGAIRIRTGETGADAV